MQTNQPTNLPDRVSRLERAVEAVRKLAGLTSAIISRGGLTLLNDSFIKMVDDMGTQVLYIGPDADGKQIYILKRENGSVVLESRYFAGQPFFAMRDQNNVILFSDNAAGVGGMARPWLTVAMTQMFRDRSAAGVLNPTGEVFGYHLVDNTVVNSEVVMWRGNASILHKFMEVRGLFGYAVGTNVPTYKLNLNGTTVGTWTQNSAPLRLTTPRYDVSAYLDLNDVLVEVTCQAPGAGATACSLESVYMRQ